MYRDQWSRSAAKKYKKMQADDRKRVDDVVKELKENPLAGKPLQGPLKGRRRVQFGAYRLVYSFDPKAQNLNLLVLDDRKDCYKKK